MASPSPLPSTYVARIADMLAVCGPPSWPSLLASDAEVLAAHALLADPVALAAAGAEARARARYLERAAVHPDSGQLVPLPLRMAAHVPANAVLLVGMLSSRSVAGTAAWQLANQCFNAAQFYCNRNATSSVDDFTLAAAFAGAVAGSVGVGVLLRRAVLRAEASAAGPAEVRLARAGAVAVPFLAAAAGKPLQIGLMRSGEWSAGGGVEVFDESGERRGRSVTAGRAAVLTTIATRVVYLAPMLWMPPLQAALERSVPLLQRSRAAAIAAYTLHAAATSAFVTPLCIAAFDQRASLPASALEAPFRGLVDCEGRAVTTLYFNKGL